ncbi:MAG: CocE/NonD family hydrolase [Sedimentisphaerales bacterium]|nr:CocE/NonD family hydrolase [Sedimentisphaerales bacterium]
MATTRLPVSKGTQMFRRRHVCQTTIVPVLAAVCLSLWSASTAIALSDTEFPAKYPDFPSEIPARFQPTHTGFDHERRTAMIPMRDGVKLHTVILVPKRAQSSPMLLTRTCYSADELTSHAQSAHYGPVLYGYDNATDVVVGGNYIRVVQDIRGKYGSEGDYVMNRPLSGPQNPTPVDHSTDTYDTIDWLVKNVPESNGRVGLLGISYNGFLTLMGAVNPHPALKVTVPMNPMVDGWLGDDWFHYGAFRQQMMPYPYEQQATRKNEFKWWTSHFDDYDMYMEAGSAGALGKRRGLEQVGFWRKILAHPSYDAFWRDQAVDRVLAGRPVEVPMMIVHSLWDAEDIYGAPAVYAEIEPKDADNDKIFLVIGPWSHGQMIGEGSSLGAIRFTSDTSHYFRQEILRPFLDRYLQDDAPQADVAPVIAYETGTNKWRKLLAWPACESGCRIKPTPLYLGADLTLSFRPPPGDEAKYDEFISDPAKPVPYRARPIQAPGYEEGDTWSQWLLDDQREASGRTDVLVYESDVLTEPLKISGRPMVNLVASTSGTDSDWVVKLIDVYPDEVAGDPKMGGYQLMVSADIFRGRYRETLETPRAITPQEPLPYRFALPTANHVFLPGHRLMVQVQSSWFPLYDRNPQTFVESIFFAQPKDYKKAVQRVWHCPDHASSIQLPLVVSKAER